MENRLNFSSVVRNEENIEGDVKIISDGTKEGTKLFLNGIELTNKHWQLLTWEFDFLLEKWTIRVENLPFPEWGKRMEEESDGE